MNFEQYYIELFEMLNGYCKKIASGKYDQSDVDKLFETGRRPQLNDVVYSSLQYSTRVRNNPQVDLLTINSDQGIVITEIEQ